MKATAGSIWVDLERGASELKLDWNRTDIDISGRGGDRGLRGVAFHSEQILVAANAALLVLDRDFKLLESFAARRASGWRIIAFDDRGL